MAFGIFIVYAGTAEAVSGIIMDAAIAISAPRKEPGQFFNGNRLGELIAL